MPGYHLIWLIATWNWNLSGQISVLSTNCNDNDDGMKITNQQAEIIELT